MRRLAISLAFLLLTGCVAAIPPVEVTRFHLGATPPPAGIVVDAATGTAADSLEFGAYAAAVRREMAQLGYTVSARPVYRVVIGQERRNRAVAQRSPVTIGIGGGTVGHGVGIGVGTSFGIGERRRTYVHTLLTVQIRRQADSTVVWEGRAETEAPESAPAAQPGLAADKLARALFQGFPGESGRTISVP